MKKVYIFSIILISIVCILAIIPLLKQKECQWREIKRYSGNKRIKDSIKTQGYTIKVKWEWNCSHSIDLLPLIIYICDGNGRYGIIPKGNETSGVQIIDKLYSQTLEIYIDNACSHVNYTVIIEEFV